MKLKLFIPLVTLLTSCSLKSEYQLKQLVAHDQRELEIVCNKFLSHNSIRHINISKANDSMKCESINDWIRCDGKWEKLNEKGQKTYIDSKEEVLQTEYIEPEDYNYFVDFLKQRNLETITWVFNCKECVDLEVSLTGLRYSANKDYLLKKDFEYLRVEKINPRWFVYTRDWN